MNLYYAYGLVVESEINLSTKISVDIKPDITVKIASLADQNQKIKSNIGRLPGVAKFLIRNGTEILVDPEPGIEESVLSPCITGSAMSVLLQQRGFLVLHASCVVINGVGVAFLGKSGDGKSTLCSAFHSRDYKILTDDVMAIRLKEDGIWVIPSIPEIKLRDDSANSLGYQAGTLSPLHPLTQKKVHKVNSNFYNQPVRLQKIYLLDQGEQHQIKPLSNQEAFIKLICHTRAVKTLRSQNLDQAHFQKCTILAREIPISRLVRKFALSELPSLVDLIEQDVKKILTHQNT